MTTVSPYVIATKVLVNPLSKPAMQSSLESLRPPVAFARRLQSCGTRWSLAQHCAAMPALSAGHSARPMDEVTSSSPGHRQKRTSSVAELPAKMAMPVSGIGGDGKAGGGGGDGGSEGGSGGDGGVGGDAGLGGGVGGGDTGGNNGGLPRGHCSPV